MNDAIKKNTVDIFVDCEKNLPEMMDATGCVWKHTVLDGLIRLQYENVRIEGVSGVRKIEWLWSVGLTTEEIISAIKEKEKSGHGRPLRMHELFALGEQYPDLQLDFEIPAFGSPWRPLGDPAGVELPDSPEEGGGKKKPKFKKFVAVLRQKGNDRVLDFLEMNRVWPKNTLFPMVVEE